VDIDDEKEDSMKDDEKEQQINQMDALIMQMKKMAAQIEKIQETVNDLQIKYQDEQKGNAQMDVMNEVKSIRETMNIFAAKMNINVKKEKFKTWVEGTLELPQYFDLFVENGIEDIATIQSFTKEELKEIGIDKIGHVKKILNAIDSLHETTENGGE